MINLAELLDDWIIRSEDYSDRNTSYSLILEAAEKISKVEYDLLPVVQSELYVKCIRSLLIHYHTDEKVFEFIQSCKWKQVSTLAEFSSSPYHPSNQAQIKNQVKNYMFNFFSLIDKESSQEFSLNSYNSMFLAGGALVGLINQIMPSTFSFGVGTLKIKDYDFYFNNKNVAFDFITFILSKFTPASPVNICLEKTEQGLKFSGISESFCEGTFLFDGKIFNGGLSQNAVTIRIQNQPDLQFIIRHIDSPEKVVRDFDFYHAMNYFNLSDYTLHLNKDGIESQRLSFLKYNPECSRCLSVYFRMQYHIKKGWRISKHDSLKVLFKLMEQDFSSKEFLVNNLSGMYRDKVLKGLEKYKDVDVLTKEQVLDLVSLYDESDKEDPIF